jgi:hypothetical protein
MPQQYSCIVCGAPFEAYPSSGKKCCSRECNKAYRTKIQTGRRLVLGIKVKKEDLQQLYEEGLSLYDIATKYGVSYATVHYYFKQFGISRRSPAVCHTENVRWKMSVARKGHGLSQETRLNMSLAKKGKPLSEAHKQKLREATMRRINDYQGKINRDSRFAEQEWRAMFPHEGELLYAMNLPDFVELKDGRVLRFIEVKSGDSIPSKGQRIVFKKLVELGFPVFIANRSSTGIWTERRYLPV